jgi:hypothetical protein
MGFWAWPERGETYCKDCGHPEHPGSACSRCQEINPWFTRCSILDLRPIETAGQFSHLGLAPKLGGAFASYGDGYRRASPRHYKDVSDDDLRADIGCLRHAPWERCDCKKTPCPVCGKDKFEIMGMCGACWYKGSELPVITGTNGGGAG